MPNFVSIKELVHDDNEAEDDVAPSVVGIVTNEEFIDIEADFKPQQLGSSAAAVRSGRIRLASITEVEEEEVKEEEFEEAAEISGGCGCDVFVASTPPPLHSTLCDIKIVVTCFDDDDNERGKSDVPLFLLCGFEVRMICR